MSEQISSSEQAIKSPEWGFAGCLVFRFLFVYFFLYSISSVLNCVPLLWKLLHPIQDAYRSAVPFLAKEILHLSQVVSTKNNGSGDTLFNWLSVGLNLVIATAGTLVWTALDWRRKNYIRLNQWFRLWLRLSLAATMTDYGGMKLFQVQFAAPYLSTLVETYGEGSPMRLLWTFMGFSRAYCVFGGLTEFGSGVLLIFPRMTTLGALIGLAVMTNIVMLNFCYDVPVKISSSHLWLMCLILLIPSMGRLFKLVVLNVSVESLPVSELFANRRLNLCTLVLQILFGLYIAFDSLTGYYQLEQSKKLDSQPKFYGIWIVDQFSVESSGLRNSANTSSKQPTQGTGDIVALSKNAGNPDIGMRNDALYPIGSKWTRVIFEYKTSMCVRESNGADHYFTFKDISKNQIQVSSDGTITTGVWKKISTPSGVFSWESTSPDHLKLVGTFDSQPTTISLHRIDTSSFFLNSRGFHWISDSPCNR